MIKTILCICILFIILAVIWGLRIIRQQNRELSYEPGIYTGPAGEPLWNGKLPERVEDYTEPRYVYENLNESTDYLPENGRIIGYRISPELVIHSRIHLQVNTPHLSSYMSRFGGKLLREEEVYLLKSNWDKISELRKKAGDTALEATWFWGLYQNMPVVFQRQNDVYKEIIGFNDFWCALILKR